MNSIISNSIEQLPSLLNTVKETTSVATYNFSCDYGNVNNIIAAEKARQEILNTNSKSHRYITGVEIDYETGKTELIAPLTLSNKQRGKLKNQQHNFERVSRISSRLRQKAKEKGLVNTIIPAIQAPSITPNK